MATTPIFQGHGWSKMCPHCAAEPDEFHTDWCPFTKAHVRELEEAGALIPPCEGCGAEALTMHEPNCPVLAAKVAAMDDGPKRPAYNVPAIFVAGLGTLNMLGALVVQPDPVLTAAAWGLVTALAVARIRNRRDDT